MSYPLGYAQAFVGMFGDGSDGAVVLDGVTSYAGSFGTPASNVYTMARDTMCTSLVINNGVTLKTNNFRCFATAFITNNGTIQANGNNAAAGVAGANLGGGTYLGGRGGGQGGTGVSGAGGSGGGVAVGNSGGAGGTGTSGAAGGAGLASLNMANLTPLLRTPWLLLAAIAVYNNLNPVPMSIGAGGGGGGSDASSNAGGGGGGGAGIIALFSPIIVNNGSMSAAGGNGAAGTAGNAGGGGGGAGGLIVAYTLSPSAGTRTVTGGTAGAGVGTGAAGNAGGVGLALNVVMA